MSPQGAQARKEQDKIAKEYLASKRGSVRLSAAQVRSIQAVAARRKASAAS